MTLPNKTRAIASAELLRREGYAEAADGLMRDTYSQLLAAGEKDDVNYAGLAELEFKRGNGQAALALLQKMVTGRIGDAGSFKLAAATAARWQSFNAALEFREGARRLNSEDAENRLEMARVLAAAGERSRAADELWRLVDERATPTTAKTAAVFSLADVVKGDRSAASQFITSYRARTTRRGIFAKLMFAQALAAAGETPEAESFLSSAVKESSSSLASIFFGTMQMKKGNAALATQAFESALYQDPEGLITQTAAFAADIPRDSLIKLYSESGREKAALALADGSPDYERTAGSSDDEGGVVYSAYHEESLLSSRPDGWFFEIYLYPLYIPPPSNLFRIPPGHGPLKTQERVSRPDEASAAKFRTIAEMNLDASLAGRRYTLRVLAQVAAREGDFQAAIEYERARRPLLVSPASVIESNTYLVTLLEKQEDAEKRLLARVRMNKAFTDEATPPSGL